MLHAQAKKHQSVVMLDACCTSWLPCLMATAGGGAAGGAKGGDARGHPPAAAAGARRSPQRQRHPAEAAHEEGNWQGVERFSLESFCDDDGLNVAVHCINNHETKVSLLPHLCS